MEFHKINMDWKCEKDCKAECCGVVPLPIQTYNAFKKKINKIIVKKMEFGGDIVLMTKDFSCVFLDNDKNRCLIYDNRPMICKLYGTIKELECPYIDIYGYKRTEEDVNKTKEFIKLQNKIRIDMIK